MIAFEDSAIIYKEKPPELALRIAVAAFGALLALAMAITFLMGGFFQAGLASATLAAITLLAAMGFAMRMFAIAFYSACDLRLDPTTGIATRTRHGPIINDQVQFPLATLSSPLLSMRHRESEPDLAILRIRFPDGKITMIACFENRAQAVEWRDHILTVLQTDVRPATL